MKTFLTSLSALSFALLSCQAAAVNSITVKGEIANTTCNITVAHDSSIGFAAILELSDISVNEFTGAGQGRGTELLDFMLLNCSGQALQNTYIHFETGLATDASNPGVLLNTNNGTTGATGLALRLLDGGTLNPIEIGSASQADGSSIELTESPDEHGVYGKLHYAVQFYSIAETVTPGIVGSQVTWILGYK